MGIRMKNSQTFKVRLIKDDPGLGLLAGDILICKRSSWDPELEYEVVYREADGFNPECNVYKSEVTRLKDSSV